MKNITLRKVIGRAVPFLFVLFILGGCASNYYQLYEAAPVSIPTENNDITISYDFWAKGGRLGMLITNNTDKIMTIYKDKCFFVLNGMSNCYYQPSTVTNTSGIVVSESIYNPWSGGLVSGGYVSTSSTSKTEEITLRMAPKSSFAISGYVMREVPYHQDGMYGGVKKDEVSNAHFTAVTSPLKFSNVMTYSIEGDLSNKTISHDFYVKEISNHHKDEFIYTMWDKGYESGVSGKSKYAAYNRFFIIYSY